jgi:hypothetical protein
VQNVLDRQEDEYLETLQELNPRFDFEMFEEFEQAFADIFKTAEANSFVKNSYHELLLKILYKQAYDHLSKDKKPVTVAEVPTGCGKSWLLVLLAAAIQ